MVYLFPDRDEAINAEAAGPTQAEANAEQAETANQQQAAQNQVEEIQFQNRKALLNQLEPSFEALGAINDSPFTKLKSFLEKEEQLLSSLLTDLASLDQAAKQSFLDNLTEPVADITLPNGLNLDTQQKIQFLNKCSELIQVRENFEAQVDIVLEKLDKSRNKAHQQHFKKNVLLHLARNLGFQPREGLVLAAKVFNDNADYKIIDICNSTTNVGDEENPREIQDLKFTIVKTNSDGSTEQLEPLNTVNFRALCQNLDLIPKITSLEDLNHIHKFTEYGQSIKPGFEFSYITNGADEQISGIRSYNPSTNAVGFTKPVEYAGQTFLGMSLESFSEFITKVASFEQHLNQNQARALLATIKQKHSNTIHSINNFDLKENDIVKLGSYSYALGTFSDDSLTFQKLKDPKAPLDTKNYSGTIQQYNYARLIYHLKHSDFEYIRNANPPVNEEAQFEFQLKEQQGDDSDLQMPELVYGTLLTPQGPLEFAKSFFSEFVEFSSLESLGQVFKTVEEAISSYTDRRTQNSANKLLSFAGNNTISSGAERKLASDIASRAAEYKSSIENTEDINNYFSKLYSTIFGTKEDDLYKAQALIEVLVDRGLLRFETYEFGVLVNKLLETAGLSQYKANVINKTFVGSGYKGKDWVIYALGQIYGPTAAKGWENQNSSNFTSKVSEGQQFADRQMSNPNTNNVDQLLHNQLTQIRNGDFSNTQHPGYLLGMLNALVESTSCALEDKMFYMVCFAATKYYGGEPILPPESLTTGSNNVDYGKYPFYSGFWSSGALGHGAIFLDQEFAERTLQKFKPRFGAGTTGMSQRYSQQAVRDYFFKNVFISQQSAPDNYEKGIENNGPTGHYERAIYMFAPRYSKSTLEDYVLGTTTPQSPTFGSDKRRHIAYGLSHGLKMTMESYNDGKKGDSDGNDKATTLYNMRRMLSAWFAYSTAVEGRNYLDNNRVKFTNDDLNFRENWIDPSTSVADQLNSVRQYLQAIVEHYSDQEFSIRGEYRKINSEEMQLWFDKDYSLLKAQEAQDPSSKQAHNSIMESFHAVLDQIATKSDFLDIANQALAIHNIGANTTNSMLDRLEAKPIAA